MLSANLIERHFAANRLDQLLDGLSSNGLDLPLSLRVRLSQHPVCGVALGLRRLVDLAYGATPARMAMMQRVLGWQESDGSYARDPLATACAAAALGRLECEPRDGCDTEVGPARQRALAALGAMQGDDGLMSYADDRTQQERALVSAFVLFLLARDAEFRGAVRFAEMMDWFEQHRGALDQAAEQYWRMARLDAADGHGPAPAHPSHRAVAA